MNSTLQNQPDHLEDWALQEAARDLTHANSLEQQHEPDLAGNLRDRAGMLSPAPMPPSPYSAPRSARWTFERSTNSPTTKGKYPMTEQTQEGQTLATVCIVRKEGEITCTWDAPGIDPAQLVVARDALLVSGGSLTHNGTLVVAREALLQMAEKLKEMTMLRLMQNAYQRGALEAIGEVDEDEDEDED